MNLDHLPPQPGEDRWHFTNDLKAPMWTRHPWDQTSPTPQQIDLSSGVTIKANYSDPQSRLDTAYSDLRDFLAAGNVPSQNGLYTIETAAASNMKTEAFRLEIESTRCRILSSDTEGIRRGIFHLEDLMLRARGPFLPLGTVERQPFIHQRISRCFFGPIKRPPRMRDELMDDVNYYPEQYLNRLAHEGVNGLWLTVEFRDLCKTRFTPDAGKDAPKRLAKLQRTVDACLRYGIRIYIFCIEPRAWDAERPVPEGYPELAGSTAYGNRQCFCPSSETAQQYLYESIHQIFTSIPELGGLINITHGERPTTCLSTVSALGEGHIDCPRCAQKEPWEILSASLSAMERGMHDAAPHAELISWLYMPYAQGAYRNDVADWVYDIPAHTPEGITLQFNFESGVERTEFGRTFAGGDYWLSTPGPSPRFDRIATIAQQNGTPVSAKIQTGCSHEVASVPYVPVPSLLYQKFKAMKHLGVSSAMLCWYFGNYPGLMNKTAGELSFEPFPENEDAFLKQLAAIDWGEHAAPKVAEAWKCFANGYAHYPLTNLFQYYGPMHDGPVWPLLLKPEDAPLSPTWLLASPITRKPWPPSGDRIGECFMEAFTLPEGVELARKMSTAWNKGVDILRILAPNYANEPERMLDIGVAEALGIQFQSGYNILRFYNIREEMIRNHGSNRLDQLAQLVDIINDELVLNKQLLTLCHRDSRLGFHSEAEGYKYYPEKIQWRMAQLKNVLEIDVPDVETTIKNGDPLFPEYTGIKPTGAVAHSTRLDESIWPNPNPDQVTKLNWEPCTFGKDSLSAQWTSAYDTKALYIIVSQTTGHKQIESPISSVLIKIEPRRLWPCKHFLYKPGMEPRAEQPDQVSPQSVEGQPLHGKIVIQIPLHRIGPNANNLHPIRMDVKIEHAQRETCSWRPSNPTTPRLRLGSDNPADLGWLLFD